MLEIYYLKAGYIPGEQYSLHARRRFRLVPAPGHPAPQQIDMSLFIVHYGPSEPNDRIPAAVVPYDERVNAIMQQRHYLLRAGQIRRKEFMLSDRVNWPALPELTRQQMGPQMVPRGVPQQMAYPTQAVPGPPAKRARHAPNQGQPAPMPGMPPMDAALDDEEDITRGDMFDHLTQREISLSRYQQNHEWMEEILSSAYKMNQITPTDLNLGLKGELAALTEGIFTAQGGEVFTQAPDKPYVGRLDPGLADEFRKRVAEHIESTQAEISRMREMHAEAMASSKEGSIFSEKERRLRTGYRPSLASDSSKMEDGQTTLTDSLGGLPSSSYEEVEEVVKEVEALTGRKILGHRLIQRVLDGGYHSPTPEPAMAAAPDASSRLGSGSSGAMMDEPDVDMGGTAAGLMDQMRSEPSPASASFNNDPTTRPPPIAETAALKTETPAPQAIKAPSPAAAVSAAAAPVAATGPVPPPSVPASAPTGMPPAQSVPTSTPTPPVPTPASATAPPAAPSTASPAPIPPATSALPPPPPPPPAATAPAAAASGDAEADVVMGGTDDGAIKHEASASPAKSPGSGEEWIVVPRGGASPETSAPPAPQPSHSDELKPAAKPPSTAETPAATTAASAFDQNDFGALGDLDTAGDALAGYDAADLADELHLPMDMADESAFGEAFHGVDASHTPGEN